MDEQGNNEAVVKLVDKTVKESLEKYRPEMSSEIQSEVEHSVQERVNQYRRTLRIVLWMFGVFAPIAVGLLSLIVALPVYLASDDEFRGVFYDRYLRSWTTNVVQKALDKAIVDKINPNIKNTVDSSLKSNVAISYDSQFRLGTQPGTDESHTMQFYATNRDRVEVFLKLVHFGKDPEPHQISIRLDKNATLLIPLADTAKDLNEVVDLKKPLKASFDSARQPTRPNVHYLTFSVEQPLREIDDTVYVQCLITVIGWARYSRQ